MRNHHVIGADPERPASALGVEVRRGWRIGKVDVEGKIHSPVSWALAGGSTTLDWTVATCPTSDHDPPGAGCECGSYFMASLDDMLAYPDHISLWARRMLARSSDTLVREWRARNPHADLEQLRRDPLPGIQVFFQVEVLGPFKSISWSDYTNPYAWRLGRLTEHRGSAYRVAGRVYLGPGISVTAETVATANYAGAAVEVLVVPDGADVGWIKSHHADLDRGQ